MTVVELARRLRAGAVSARELAQQALDAARRRADLNAFIALDAERAEAAASAIQDRCLYSHTTGNSRTWYSCDPRTRADLTDEIEYLTLCGLLDIIHGDVMLVRIRTELLS